MDLDLAGKSLPFLSQGCHFFVTPGDDPQGGFPSCLEKEVEPHGAQEDIGEPCSQNRRDNTAAAQIFSYTVEDIVDEEYDEA